MNRDMIAGRFAVLDRLHDGPSKIIYLVCDRRHGNVRRVLKCAREGDVDAAAAIENEWRLLSDLSHPEILGAIDLAHDDGGSPLLVLEQAPGKSLYEHGHLDPRTFTAVAYRIARALAYLHERGIGHFDVKPDNVVCLFDPETAQPLSLKLIDYDFAAPPGPECRRRGTMPFVAPEILDDDKTIDARADLYSFGVTLMALMLGEALPRGDSFEEFRSPASPLSTEVTERFGARAVALVRSLIEIDADARPASARDVMRLLDAPAAEAELFDLSGITRPRFFGRKIDLVSLNESIPSLRSPRVPGGKLGHTFVIVRGEPGVGKSRLVERSIVETRLRTTMTVVIAAQKDGAWTGHPADVVLRALPAPSGSDAESISTENDTSSVVDYRKHVRAVDRILEWTHFRAIRIVVEDVDNADDDASIFYFYLARRLMHEVVASPSPAPVQVVFTGTPEAFLSAQWSELLHEVRKEHLGLEISLEPFAFTDFTEYVGGLITPRTISPEALAVLLQTTRGVPAAIRETVVSALSTDDALRDPNIALSPANLAKIGATDAAKFAVRGRVARLEAIDRKIVAALAVHPATLTIDDIAAAFAETPTAVHLSCARLVRAGFVHELTSGAYHSSGRDARDGVLSTLENSALIDIHDALARVLSGHADAVSPWWDAYHRVCGSTPDASLDLYYRCLSQPAGNADPTAYECLANAIAACAALSSPWLVRLSALKSAEWLLARGRSREASIRLASPGPRRYSAVECGLSALVAAATGDTRAAEKIFADGILEAARDPKSEVEILMMRTAWLARASETSRAAADLERIRALFVAEFGGGFDLRTNDFDFDHGRVGPLPPRSVYDRIFAEALALEAENAWQSRRGRDAARAGLSALKVFARLGDIRGCGRSLHVLGNAYSSAERSDRAAVYYSKAVAVHQRSGDLAAAAATLNSLGNLEINRSRHSDALEHLRRSLEIRCDIGDKSGEIQSQTLIGKSYLARGELAAAEKALKHALASTRRTARRTAVILNMLGVVHELRGRYATALGFFKDAVTADRKLGRAADALGYEVNAARIQLRIGQYARAFRIAVRILRAAVGLNVERAEGNALLVLADVHFARSRPLSARRALERAHDVFVRIGSQSDVSDVLVRRLACEILGGDVEAAAVAFAALRRVRFEASLDETWARRSAVELRFFAFRGDTRGAHEEVERAIGLANELVQNRRPDPAFIVAAALARHFEFQGDRERSFAYYTMALDQLESLVHAIGDPRMIVSFMKTPEIQEFSAHAKAFVENDRLDARHARVELPDEARQVFESVKKGFFDFERSVGVSSAHRRRHDEGIRRILEISQTLSSTAPLDELLVKVVDGVIDFTGAERGFVILAGPKGQWRIAVARTMHREPISLRDPQVSTHIIDRIFETRKQMMVGDAMSEENFRRRASVINLELRSVMGAPMIRGDRMIGMLYVDHRSQSRIFLDDDLQLLRILATHVAIALENARLVREFVRDEKMRHMGLMASGVAHDFNNILAGILGRSQLLAEKIKDGPEAVHLAMIDKAARDGTLFVKRLQDSTRLSKSGDLTTVFMRTVVDDVIGFTRPRWETESLRLGRTIKVVNEVPSNAGVVGNAAELREVFTNVLLNAVAAMPYGGTVRFEANVLEDRVRIFVKDTGIGMSESVRERIFDPFFTTKDKDRKGSGLGMSIVFGILMRHGGSIDVESQVGVGTNVSIELPRAGDKDLRGVLAEPHELTGNGQCILVVDDEDGIRSLLREVIGRAGYRVLEAASAMEALDLVDAHSVDAIITDLGMVPMSGIDMAAKIKQSRPTMPIVLLTGWASEISPDQAGMACVDKMIGKPFDNAHILAAIANLL